MFKFNFGYDDAEDGVVADESKTVVEGVVDANITTAVAAAQSLAIPAPVMESKEFFPISAKSNGSVTFSSLSALTTISDVVAGVYEGGFKKWECSDDLVGYLRHLVEGIEQAAPVLGEEAVEPFELDDIRGSRVVDLGCGQGIPGLYTLHQNSATVVFQDLNEDVLSSVTVPNVVGAIGLSSVIRKAHKLGSMHSAITVLDNVNTSEALTSTVLQESAVETSDILITDNSISSKLSDVRHLLAVNERKRLGGKRVERDAKAEQTSIQERAHYEFLKAQVLQMAESENPEDIDEDLLHFIAMVEAEMAEEGDENGECKDNESEGDSQEDDNNENEDEDDDEYEDDVIVITGNDEDDVELPRKKKKGKEKSKTSSANIPAASVPDEAKSAVAEGIETSYIAKPHGQFISGPWASQELTDLLIAANPGLAPTSLVLSSSSAFIPSSNTFSVAALSSSNTSVDSEVLKNISQLFNDSAAAMDTSVLTARQLHTMISAPNNILLVAKKSESSSTVTQDTLATLATNLSSYFDISFRVCSNLASLSVASNSENVNESTSRNSPTSFDSPVIAAILLSLTPNAASIEWISSGSANLSTPTARVPSSQAAEHFEYSENSIIARDAVSVLIDTVDKLLNTFFPKINNESPRKIINLTCRAKNYPYYLSLGFRETGWQVIDNENGDSQHCVKMIRAVTSSTTFTLSDSCQFQVKFTPMKDLGLEPLVSNSRFDCILSADTLYSVDTMPVLIKCLRNILHLNGCALIAAKRYYFGVGGSTAQFVSLIEEYSDMICVPVRIFQDGASNIREILLVKWDSKKF